jgi:lysophospholipase L1-like esterase
VYHITPPFEVPAGTYSYNGIDSYWSFYVYKDGTKTRINGAASGTLILTKSATIYLSTRENLGAYANVNWVSGSTVYYVAPNKGYFSEKIEMLDGITQIMASVGMFTSVAALGDSYTAASVKNSAGTWHDYPNNSWIATMCKRSGIDWFNYGHGGTTVKTYLTTSEFSALLSDAARDMYFICFGINDYGQSLTVGTIADINDADYTQNPDSFYGCYGKIIQQIINHAPNAKITLIKAWTSTAAKSAYGDATAAIAEHYGIPCIDPYDDILFSGGYLASQMNNGHPTLLGYSQMGIAMERLFSECVMDNLSYFKFATVG